MEISNLPTEATKSALVIAVSPVVMESAKFQSESQDCVPGSKKRASNITEWPVDMVTGSSIHECQLQAESLTDGDKQLFRKAITMVIMETDQAILKNMEVKILTDSHQYLISSGTGEKKMVILRDEHDQVKSLVMAGEEDDQHVIKISSRNGYVCSEDIHRYQINAKSLTESELTLFRTATMITPPRSMAHLCQNMSVTILADTRQFEFSPRSAYNAMIIQLSPENKVVYGLFANNPSCLEAWEKFRNSWKTIG